MAASGTRTSRRRCVAFRLDECLDEDVGRQVVGALATAAHTPDGRENAGGPSARAIGCVMRGSGCHILGRPSIRNHGYQAKRVSRWHSSSRSSCSSRWPATVSSRSRPPRRRRACRRLIRSRSAVAQAPAESLGAWPDDWRGRGRPGPRVDRASRRRQPQHHDRRQQRSRADVDHDERPAVADACPALAGPEPAAACSCSRSRAMRRPAAATATPDRQRHWPVDS